jgi:peroxiredoxin
MYYANGNMNIKKINEISDSIIKGLIGCQIPDFSVKTIDGKTITTSELKGKIIVLNFWFTACSPCVAEMPALNKLVAEYNDSNVVFIAFSTDDSLSVNKFLQNKEFNYNMVSSTYDMKDKFCIRTYPTNMVFDRSGVLRQIFCGGPIDERAKVEAYTKIKPTIDKYLMVK